MHMVDDLTPYFQDRMRQLPPTQRKIVEFLSLESTPTLIKEIAAACLMSHQTASKQIGELPPQVCQPNPLGTQYVLRTVGTLMRICIEVKDNRTRHFRLFVEFLRHWFSSRELERRMAAFSTIMMLRSWIASTSRKHLSAFARIVSNRLSRRSKMKPSGV